MQEYIWLSHVLDATTPGYKGKCDIEFSTTKSIAQGDSCNQKEFRMSNHLGTHVDVPYHFIENGKKLNDYTVNEWIFSNILLLDISLNNHEEITTKNIEKYCYQNNKIDLVLFKTDYEQHRYTEKYWRDSPVFRAELAEFLLERFPNIKAIGMDALSLTSLNDRDEGSRAHREFLKRDIRIFEDMKLSNIVPSYLLNTVFAFPLRLENADGAPCTIIGVK